MAAEQPTPQPETDWREGYSYDERHDVYVSIAARFQMVDPEGYARALRGALAMVETGRLARAEHSVSRGAVS